MAIFFRMKPPQPSMDSRFKIAGMTSRGFGGGASFPMCFIGNPGAGENNDHEENIISSSGDTVR
jgi:hypothetical protein